LVGVVGSDGAVGSVVASVGWLVRARDGSCGAGCSSARARPGGWWWSAGVVVAVTPSRPWTRACDDAERLDQVRCRLVVGALGPETLTGDLDDP
jgi:hypothetical protein